MNSLSKFELDAFIKFADLNFPVSTTQGTKSMPFQRWFRFKEGFSPAFISETINGSVIPVRTLLDCFGGSGSSAITAQFHGVVPITCEINPFLSDLIESKLKRYSFDDVRIWLNLLLESLDSTEPRMDEFISSAPPTFIEPGVGGRWIYSKEIAFRIAQYITRIDCFPPKFRRLFRILLASCLVPVSNVVINGKGRRYRRNWETRQKSISDLDALFLEKVNECLYDISIFPERETWKYKHYRGDCRRTLPKIKDKVDLIVFSPPYPNTFDYTDIYNIELWMLGYLNSSDQNRRLRRSTVRSHVSIQNEYETNSGIQQVSAIYESLKDVRARLWNKWIPEMVCSYFADLEMIVKQCSRIIRKNGDLVIVIGNSSYAGVDVDCAEVLAEIAQLEGFRVVDIDEMRLMRSSAQQGGMHKLKEWKMTFRKY
jgi:DNA modification methylase